MNGPGDRVQRVPGVVHRWHLGEILTLGRSDELQVLAGAAAIVYGALDRPRSLTELEEQLHDGPAGTPSPGAVAEALVVLRDAGLVAPCSVP